MSVLMSEIRVIDSLNVGLLLSSESVQGAEGGKRKGLGEKQLPQYQYEPL